MCNLIERDAGSGAPWLALYLQRVTKLKGHNCDEDTKRELYACMRCFCKAKLAQAMEVASGYRWLCR